MTVPAAGKHFGRARRRAIAQACRMSPRTRAELGRQLGVNPGGLEQTLKAMTRETILEPVEVPHARGVAFKFNTDWDKELDAALAATHPVGLLRPGLRLLLVAGNQAALEAGLKAAATDPAVMWAARVDGRGRLLLALEAGAPELVDQVDRLEGIFSEGGADAVQLVVDQVMDRDRVTRYARAVVSRPHSELPPANP